MLKYINEAAAKCLRTSVKNSPGIKEIPQIDAKAVKKTVGDNEISLEILLSVFGDENIVIYISNCVESLRNHAGSLIEGEDDEYCDKTLIHDSADFLLNTLDTLFTTIISKPGPNSHIKSCSISELSPAATVLAEQMYPNFIPLWNVVPSTLSEALTHSQALLSTTGKVYLFGDPSHLLHQHRNMTKMATETTTVGCYVEELMSFGFVESGTSPLDPTVKPESASGGSDRGDSNADLKSQKHSESSDSEQPSPIMPVIIDMLRLRPGYANGEDRRKIQASPVLEEAANEVTSLFQSINEHVPQSYYDDRTTLTTQNNGIITISGGLSMVYFLHDVIRWMNTDAGGECLSKATENIIPRETRGPWAQKPGKETMTTLMLEALEHVYHQQKREYHEEHKSLTFYRMTLS